MYDIMYGAKYVWNTFLSVSIIKPMQSIHSHVIYIYTV